MPSGRWLGGIFFVPCDGAAMLGLSFLQHSTQPPPAMKHSIVLAAIACVFYGSSARAQEQDQDSIEADRPDFVESSKVVGKGRLQLETSMLLERERSGEGRERTLSTPTLLRIGVSRELELRVETEGRMVRHGVEE